MTRNIDRRLFLGTMLASSTAATLRATEPDETSSAAEMLAAVRQNESIHRAREIAADILQPSPKQLAHGMELHANSLVFDTYGFAPRAAVDGDALREAAESGASDIELQDLREQMTMTRFVSDEGERAEFVQAWQASGVTCIFQNAGEESQAPLTLLKRLARFTYATDMMRDFMAKAATPDDIVAAKRQGRRCLYLTGNGVPLTQQWVSVEDELRYLSVFFQLGIRMMHLTYQRRNMIGDGCAESSNAGLSDFGRTVVAAMNKVGVIVDIAHSGWRTSLEAAQTSQRPMVASHSTCTALHHHIRSKPDEVIKAIADSGGLIGVCCIPRFLGGSGDITALLDHIDHVVKTFGVDHVGIGTDVSYTSRNYAAERKKIPSRPKSRADWRSLWPPDPFKETPEGIQSIAWTNWPMFTVGLVQRGYSDDDIQKIIGGNMLRVARAALNNLP
jgi:membrane dipeptidase